MKAVQSLVVLFVFFFAISVAQAGDRKIPDAPADYLAMENPIDYDDLEGMPLKRVKRLYKSKCKKCHGSDGDGQGSAASTMEIKPTAFNVPDYLEDRKDGQLFWITMYGSKGTEMKAFGPGTDVSLSEEEIWKLIGFIRANFAD